MISERERDLLRNIKNMSENEAKRYTDEEIIDNMVLFLYFKDFRESDRIVNLLLRLDNNKLKELGYISNIPRKLHFKDALILLDRGLGISKYAFTEKYLYDIATDKENLIKYKHLISFETVIQKKLWFVHANSDAMDNFIEVCYDELREVSTRTLLDALGVKLGDDCPNWDIGFLMDKLVTVANREFNDTEIINVLLDAITGLIYTNSDFYNKIFKYFDDKYILENIKYFNPIQLGHADRLTEKMLEKMVGTDEWNRYEYGLSNMKLQVSYDFLINNHTKIKNRWILINQKNIITADRLTFNKILTKEENVKVYLHNEHLDNDDLEYLKESLKDTDINFIINNLKIDDYTPPLALKRLVELKEYEDGKN